MEKTAKGLVEYVIAQLGKPYWYGTFGQAASKSLHKQKRKQFPLQYLWSYKNEKEKVHDCVGLIKGYLWCDSPSDKTPTYNAEQDISANQMRKACTKNGKISTIPEEPGILVFYTGHVGVYIGNGEVIEARSRKYGVAKTKLADRPWTSWGYCPYITYEEPKKEEPEKEVKPAAKTNTLELPILKKGAKGETVKTMQILLNAKLKEKLGNKFVLLDVDGSFGAKTLAAVIQFQELCGLEATGNCGRKTWTSLLGL